MTLGPVGPLPGGALHPGGPLDLTRSDGPTGRDVIGEWEDRKRAARFTEEDAHALDGAYRHVESIADDLVERFYSNIAAHRVMRDLIADPNVLANLKRHQRAYLLELFSGSYDEDYARRRSEIGRAHERLGLDLDLYISAYGVHFERLVPFLFERMGAAASSTVAALSKIVLLDMGIVSSCYIEHHTRGIRKANRELVSRLDRDQDLLETISDTSIDAILSLNASGHIQFWNRAAEGILGLSAEELEGRSFLELLRPRCKPELPERLRALRSMELSYTNPRGDARTLLLSAAAMRDDRREDVRTAVILRDITEKRRLQQRVSVMEKISAMARVSGAIAHELRTPLGALVLQTDMLSEHLDKHEPSPSWQRTARDLATDLALEADRLNNIVSDYLSMLRISRMAPQETDPVEYLTRVERELRRRINEWPVSLSFNVPESLPSVRIDQDQFRRVFLNLFTNAIEATQRQGNVRIAAHAADGQVHMCVEDDGPGIPPTEREQVLEAFFTTKREGTGLGLYLVNQIVTAHGGRLDLKSNQPTGLRVCVCLPELSRSAVPVAD